MTVLALAPYDFPAKDVRANFAQPLMYFGWDEHMMFCAPLAVPMDLNTRFDAVISRCAAAVVWRAPRLCAH